MKKNILLISLVFVAFTSLSSAQIDMSVFAGISTPNKQMSLVYEDNNSPWDFAGKAISIGWHLGTRMRLSVKPGFYAFFGMGWYRFSNAQIEVKYADTDTTYKIKARQDIIPIGIGAQYYIISSAIKFYVIGQINYNYFTTHGEYLGLPAPNFDLSDATGRMGFQTGVGVEFNLVMAHPFFEFSYAMPNLLGKAAGEPTKQFFNFSLGVNM